MSEITSLPVYKCTRVVQAFKIYSINFYINDLILQDENYYYSVTVSFDYYNKYSPKEGGYYIRHEDGYESYSPAKAFEEGYILETHIPLESKAILRLKVESPEEHF